MTEFTSHKGDIDTTASLIEIMNLAIKNWLESRDADDEASAWSAPIQPLFKPGGTLEQSKRVLATVKKMKCPLDKSEVQEISIRLHSLSDSVITAPGWANLVGIDTNKDVKFASILTPGRTRRCGATARLPLAKQS